MVGTAVVIIDKDGGRATELRENGDIPVFISPSGDQNQRTPWNEAVEINAASGDVTIHTPASGKKFYVETLVIALRNAAGITLKSGTTKISGQMSLAANGGIAINNGDTMLRGRAVGNSFVISTSGDGGIVPVVGGYAAGYDE